MVMLRRGIPLVPQELLGYKLGLTIPQGCDGRTKGSFFNPRISNDAKFDVASILPYEPQVFHLPETPLVGKRAHQIRAN